MGVSKAAASPGRVQGSHAEAADGAQSGVENSLQATDVERNASTTQPKLTLSYIFRKNEYRHALYSGIVTLTLSIMGGAVLPVSYAFTVTGIICGFLIMVVVASANAYTCDLLLRQAYHTGAMDYESLAFCIGGKWWKLATEISIVVLLLGTIIGSIQQVGEAAVSGISRISTDTPNWLTGGSGRLLTLLFVIIVVAPFCLVEKMRQLEYAATVGTSIVLWLLVVIVVDAIKYNLPAVGNGQLATAGFSSLGSVTQAVSTFGFAFYIQPMMMPFLAEMPAGRVGVKLTSYSVRTVILGTAFFIYGAVGFFGAARYGKDTASNILENKWLGGGVAQGVLNLAMSVYLALSIPTLEFPTRHTLNDWLPGDKQKRLLRHLCISGSILAFCTGISLIWPNKSGTVVTITGATGVCMVSYIIPIANHLLLFFQRANCQQQQGGSGAACGNFSSRQSNVAGEGKEVKNYRQRRWRNLGTWSLIQEHLLEVTLPILVVVVGIFCSVAALSTL